MEAPIASSTPQTQGKEPSELTKALEQAAEDGLSLVEIPLQSNEDLEEDS